MLDLRQFVVYNIIVFYDKSSFIGEKDMTKYEKNEFKKWNIEISVNEMNANEKASAIESKYLKLNGSRSCNPETFIFEIATTETVSKEERLSDIRIYISYLESCAKGRALSDILHIYR